MKLALTILVFITNVAIGQNIPIALNLQNPHYFTYKNKPTVLITSGEHYGAVLNLDFDFEKYITTLHKDGLNLTRLFTGALYVEPTGAFNIERNTLAPLPLKFISPYARSKQPGYINDGNKFDLTKWDAAYFSRLKKFISIANDNNVIVELTLFCPFYDSTQWKLSPLNDSNNINHIVTDIKSNEVYTISSKTAAINALQAKFVSKVVTELNGFDNLMYEITNEPYFGGITLEWQHFIAKVIDSTEKHLSKKHLITQNIANDSALISKPDSLVSVFNFHYAWPVTVAENYHLDKVIGCNETGFKGTSDSIYRLQARQFMLAGGGLFNNLDYSFVAGFEDGNFKYHKDQPGGGSVALRNQLSILKNFIATLNFIHMQPDSSVIKDASSKEASIKILSNNGKEYAAHIKGGNNLQLQLALPSNTYKVMWIDPLSGDILSSKIIHVNNALTTLAAPAYTTDIALKIVRE